MPKIAFQKRHLSFTWFFSHCTAKNKNIALKIGMYVVCIELYNIYSDFMDTSHILDFIGIYFINIRNFEFLDQIKKNKKYEIVI